ncbi:hypothetical protein [Mesorhizobium sp. WSM3626]|nr:hypothetical protein [Mesorhizobium sp. WSM3626]
MVATGSSEGEAGTAIGPLGLPTVIVALDALLVAFALYRSASRRSS